MKIGGTDIDPNGKVQRSTPISAVQKDKNFTEKSAGQAAMRPAGGTEIL
jgi:hypothetical protein